MVKCVGVVILTALTHTEFIMRDEDVPDYGPQKKPFWRCEECGFENRIKPMPTDRDKFYSRCAEKGSPKCPKCKSEAYMPVGY